MMQRWPSGLRAVVLVIISGQKVLWQFVRMMRVHTRHRDRLKRRPAHFGR